MCELEVEKPLEFAFYLHSAAMQRLHAYTHGSPTDSAKNSNADPGDAALDGGVAPDGGVAADGGVVPDGVAPDGDVAPDGGVAPDADEGSDGWGDTDTSNREDDSKSRQAKLGELDEAIKMMRRALDIARKIYLGTVAGVTSNRKRPSLAAWTSAASW